MQFGVPIQFAATSATFVRSKNGRLIRNFVVCRVIDFSILRAVEWRNYSAVSGKAVTHQCTYVYRLRACTRSLKPRSQNQITQAKFIRTNIPGRAAHLLIDVIAKGGLCLRQTNRCTARQ
jgi:hypothetical protein